MRRARLLRAGVAAAIAAASSVACSALVDWASFTSGTDEAGATADGAPTDAVPGDAAGSDAADAAADVGACPATRGRPLIRAGDRGYCVDATEVTNADYALFLSARGADAGGQPTGCAFNATFAIKCPELATGPNEPVTCVNWCDAFSYCAWAGKRLCGQIGGGATAGADWTSAAADQWYRACSRAGARPYPYGATYRPEACNDLERDAGRPIAVGSLATCTGGYDGLFDMSGNVIEWTDGCQSSTGENDLCPIRGGAYDDSLDGAACTLAYPVARKFTDTTIGFRCCSDP